MPPCSLPQPFSQESLLGLIPVKNPYFTGRDEKIRMIELCLSEAQQGVITQSIVGLGGIGKTQLVTEYVHQSIEKKRYGLVVWLDGANPSEAYQNLGKLLGLQLDSKDSEKQCIAMIEKRILSGNYPSLLFVWDDAQSPEQMYSYLSSALRLKAHCLMTSRMQNWGGARANFSMIRLNVFNESEALLYIKTRCMPYPGLYDEVAAKDLADILQYFPLALSQAVAYIVKKREQGGRMEYSFRQYLEEYKQAQISTLKRFYQTSASLPEDVYEQTIWTTWYLSIKALKEANKHLAVSLIEICAYLEGNLISDKLLSMLAQASEDDIEESIDALLSYSLVERIKDNQFPAIKIHQLLQAVICLHLQEEPLPFSIPLSLPALMDVTQHDAPVPEALIMRRYLTDKASQWLWDQRKVACEVQLSALLPSAIDLTTAQTQRDNLTTALRKLIIPESHDFRHHQMIALLLKQLDKTFRYDERHMEQLREVQISFAPHVKAVCNHALVAEVGEPNAAGLLFRLGRLSHDIKDAKEMREIYLKILPYYERFYPNHPLLGQVLNNLGNAYGDLGDHQEKKRLLQRALAIKERYYGPEHVEVAITLNNLANAYGDLGNHQEKKRLLQRALKIFVREYGPENIHVASTLGNLGNAYGLLGEYQEQKRLLERALEIFERYYGPEHREVATTLNNLGTAYGALGEFQAAQNSYHRALRINQHFLRKGHPEVGRVFFNLADLHFKQQEFALGLEYLKQAHGIYLHHPNCGPTHPYTHQATARLNQLTPQLSIWEATAPQYTNSQRTGDQAFQDKNYTTAIQHWLIALPFLAAQSFLSPARKFDAILLHERLGDAYREQGELDKALANFTQAQTQLTSLTLQQSEVYLRVTNKKSACEIKVAANLAHQKGVTHYKVGNWAQALIAFQEGLEKNQVFFEKQIHADLASSHWCLSSCYLQQTNYTQALGHVEQAYTLRYTLFGKFADLTQKAKERLTLCREKIANSPSHTPVIKLTPQGI
jgi:tetratricopeptide (TPR) repeat protein